MQHFYHPDLTQPLVTLSEKESEHCVRTLRHRNGDQVRLTDGKGGLATGTIVDDHPKHCVLEVSDYLPQVEIPTLRLHLAIAPTKNMDRMEWLLEKAVEVGVQAVTFLFCDHSERPRVNLERLERIAISALKQSQTTLLPRLQVLAFRDFMKETESVTADKFIAWCDDDNTRQLVAEPFQHQDIILLIGPEGDFSPNEITEARKQGFVEVKLGNRRLRTETAGLYGCMAVAMRACSANPVIENN